MKGYLKNKVIILSGEWENFTLEASKLIRCSWKIRPSLAIRGIHFYWRAILYSYFLLLESIILNKNNHTFQMHLLSKI